MLRRFDKLPRRMQNPAVKRYYDILKKKAGQHGVEAPV